MNDQPIFLTLEEMRQAEKEQAEREEHFWKYGHMLSASDEWLQECIEKSTDPEEVRIAINLLNQTK